MYVLNKSGPRIDPCRTPQKTSFHRLKSQLTFVFCICLFR